MSMPRPLAAHTAPAGSYPPFVSINLISDDVVEITVRSPPQGATCGLLAAVQLTRHEFLALVGEALERV